MGHRAPQKPPAPKAAKKPAAARAGARRLSKAARRRHTKKLLAEKIANGTFTGEKLLRALGRYGYSGSGGCY